MTEYRPQKTFTVNVTQYIIDMCKPNSQKECMIALPLWIYKGFVSISVSKEQIKFSTGGIRYTFDVPAVASKNVQLLDSKGKSAVKPFSFKLQKGTSAPIKFRGPRIKPYKERKPYKRPDSRFCTVRRNSNGTKVRIDSGVPQLD
jgi:hypothetical protein